MSATPAFDIGIWNAWIFMLIYALPVPILMNIHKGVLQESLRLYSKARKTANYIVWALWALASVYSIFLPLRIGTPWFYTGLPIALVGLIAYVMVVVTLATNPMGKKPVTIGPYRYSRHPMYVTQLVLFIGVGLASASWLFLLLTIVYTVVTMTTVIAEEGALLRRFGEDYRRYMERTPRFIGLPK